jgi:hypothetical protein
MDWRERSLEELLRAHRLDPATEQPFPNDGWSGATFSTVLDDAGRRFVLKRTSLAADWIARATRDGRLREAWVAASGGERAALPHPYLGAAQDGAGAVILSPDLSRELIVWDRPLPDEGIDAEALDRILRAMARLHVARWDRKLAGVAPPPPWCPLRDRLLLLSRATAAGYAADGNPVGDRFLSGWAAFERFAPPSARELIASVSADPGPLLAALGRLQWVGLHGDLKLANVALMDDGDVQYIDWQLTLVGPVAVELAWFLVSNSGSLRASPDAVLDDYVAAMAGSADGADVIGDVDVQRDLTWILGLLLRGWRKGLDTQAGTVLPSGVSAADDLGWWSACAVEAAGRRL